MQFSNRVPSNLDPNRFSLALARAREMKQPLLDLTVSNPTVVGIDYSQDLLGGLADSGGLTYEPRAFGLPSARQSVSSDFARRQVKVAPEHVVLTASTSEAYSFLFKLLCNPGDRVLVPRPSYPLFEHLTRLDAVEADFYLLEYHGHWSVDADSLQRAMTPRTRAVLAVSPNNPTGSFLDQRDLEVLGEICRQHNLALIGDEVFADYAFDRPSAGAEAARPPNVNHPSVLSLDDILVFSLGGLSKSAALPQLKLGWIGVGGPSKLTESALDRLEIICDSYLSVATPVQLAAGALIASAAVARDMVASRIRRNYTSLVEKSSRHPSCEVLPVEGGWYAVVRVPATQPEEDLVVALLEEDGVVVHPGYFYDFAHEAFLVVSLLPEPETFDRAAERVFNRAARG